jgi:hypothetical protein
LIAKKINLVALTPLKIKMNNPLKNRWIGLMTSQSENYLTAQNTFHTLSMAEKRLSRQFGNFTILLNASIKPEQAVM